MCDSRSSQQGTTSKPVVVASGGLIWQEIDRHHCFPAQSKNVLINSADVALSPNATEIANFQATIST